MAYKLDAWLKKSDAWLWQTEATSKTRLGRFLLHSARVMFAVIRDLIYGHITLHAMSLVYTTLLSIVPFLALSFSVLKAFGVHNQLEPLLEQWVAPLGENGDELVENVLTFIDNMKVTVLGSVGLGVLIFTVVRLVQKVEYSFNEIWRVTEVRSIGQRFSNYLSVIIIGPVLVVAAVGATTTVVSSDVFKQLIAFEPLGWIYAALARTTTYLMIIGLFTFLYMFVPNTRVQLRYAFAGAFVGGVLWQSASFAFALFVQNSNQYSSVYSGFAVGIFALIWLFVSWAVLLVGAAVSFYAQHSSQITRERRVLPSATVDELTGLAIMYKVAKQFDNAGGGAAIADIETHLSVGPETTRRITDKLIKHRLLMVSNNGRELLPGRSLDKITIKQLINAVRSPEIKLPYSLLAEPAVNKIEELIVNAFECEAGEQTVAEWIRNVVDETELDVAVKA